ncbi:30S ribosomal protein S2 [Chloroflexota bacterium]
MADHILPGAGNICPKSTRLWTCWSVLRIDKNAAPAGLKEADGKREGVIPMAVVSMKALLESGVHFGHRTNKWDPRMKPYIFTERNGIHIIDLQQTVKALDHAFNVIRNNVAEGGVVMFVGTKRQAQETILEEANRCGMPYVTNRWLGGMLTNWRTMHQRILDMERMEKQVSGDESSRMTKKEGLLIQRQIDKLQTRLSGVRDMKGLPDLIFIVDIKREEAAVHEANLLNIPIVALVDTNCDPTPIDYVVPSNDDAIRAIKLLVGKVADAVLEGLAMRKDAQDERDAEGGPDQQAGEGKPERMMEQEEDLSDADLLGSSTLAKMNVQEESEVEETPQDEEPTEDEGTPDEKIVPADESEKEESVEEDEDDEEEETVEKIKTKAKKPSKEEEDTEEDEPLEVVEKPKAKKKAKPKKPAKDDAKPEEEEPSKAEEKTKAKKKAKPKKPAKDDAKSEEEEPSKAEEKPKAKKKAKPKKPAKDDAKSEEEEPSKVEEKSKAKKKAKPKKTSKDEDKPAEK